MSEIITAPITMKIHQKDLTKFFFPDLLDTSAPLILNKDEAVNEFVLINVAMFWVWEIWFVKVSWIDKWIGSVDEEDWVWYDSVDEDDWAEDSVDEGNWVWYDSVDEDDWAEDSVDEGNWVGYDSVDEDNWTG